MNLETIFEKQLVNSNPLCDSVYFILVDGDDSKVASQSVKSIDSLELNGYEHRHTYCGHPFFYKVSL
jgi:hypothetical protein